MKKTVKTTLAALTGVKSLLENIEDVSSNSRNVDLAYYAMKNIDLIKAELKYLDESPALKVPESFKEFEQQREQLVVKYATRDDDGNVIQEDGGRVSIQKDKVDQFSKEFEELRAKYQETFKEVDEVNKNRVEFLGKEIEVDLFTFSRSLLGELKSEGKPNGWTYQVMATLSPVLDEE